MASPDRAPGLGYPVLGPPINVNFEHPAAVHDVPSSAVLLQTEAPRPTQSEHKAVFGPSTPVRTAPVAFVAVTPPNAEAALGTPASLTSSIQSTSILASPSAGLRTAPGPPVYVSNNVYPSVAAAHAHEEELRKEWEIERQRLVSGLDNDDLNALLRTFDKYVHNVHAAPPAYDAHIPRGLDLQPVEDEEFTVDKLRSALERFYASIVVGFIRFGQEFLRIWRWEDGGGRTIIGLSIYAIAWHNNIIITTFMLFLGMLMLFPTTRTYCFARPDKPFPWGPASSETKASEWAAGVEQLLLSMAKPNKASKTSSNVAEQVVGKLEDKVDQDMDDKEDLGEKGKGDGKKMSRSDKAMELYGQPMMRIIAGLADKWERIANAIEPTPHGYLESRRGEAFCLLILPLLPVTTFVPARMISKALGAGIGFAVFGKPVIDRVLHFLDEAFPHWKMDIILKNNILSDVPTNSQLVLRILRDREHRRRPIPLPSDELVPDHGENSDDDDESESEEEHTTMEKMKGATQKARKRGKNKLRRALEKTGKWKEETFAFITGHKQVDYQAKVKHGLAKAHLPTESKLVNKLPRAHYDEASPDTPSRFYVHHEKHGPGHLIIHPPSGYETGLPVPARLEFTTLKPVGPEPVTEFQHSANNLIASIEDIVGIKKEGMGWPGRIASSVLLGTTEAGGTGMEIRLVRRDGALATGFLPDVETVRFKGLVRRNELFDRLVAMGDQRWEML